VKQPNPSTLRIPEEWKPEIELAAQDEGTNPHAWKLNAIYKDLQRWRKRRVRKERA
jgi:hypothetical protein